MILLSSKFAFSFGRCYSTVSIGIQISARVTCTELWYGPSRQHTGGAHKYFVAVLAGCRVVSGTAVASPTVLLAGSWIIYCTSATMRMRVDERPLHPADPPLMASAGDERFPARRRRRRSLQKRKRARNRGRRDSR
ncbi:unnamed protein product [Aphis gossypii]|uniref:Uncharacterized protein n=1 Tax=Aphis gossypii TaxID=80765 RepID=A0A9P0NNT1_APHGO|nr:unnamed protein product [Aphis gossypii]